MTSADTFQDLRAAAAQLGKCSAIRHTADGDTFKGPCPFCGGSPGKVTHTLTPDGKVVAYCHECERTAVDIAEAHGVTGTLFPDSTNGHSAKPSRTMTAFGDRKAAKYVPPTDTDMDGWSNALHADPELLAHLTDERCLSVNVILQARLGHDGDRYVLPVLELDGSAHGVVRYKPGGSPKVKADAGSTRAPSGVEHLHHLADNKTLCIVEAELDALALRSHGFNAIGVPCWKEGWHEQYGLARFDCVAIGDNDEAGVKYAGKVRADIPDSRVLAWPEDRKKGHDPTDELLREDGCARMESLIAEAVKVSDETGEVFAPVPLDIGRVLTEPTPPIPWIYRPWFAEGDRVLIAADGGVGKSALSLDLALALTTGADWLGARNNTGGRRVVYLDEEMPERLVRRRIQLAATRRTVDADRLHYFCEAGFNLDDGATHEALEEQLAWAGEERGFLILDTLIRFHRRNENDAGDMGKLFGMLRVLLNKHGVGLITDHHEAKTQFGQGGGRSGQQKARGSTDIPNFHDVTISYERDATDRDKRVLRLNKSRWWMSAEETEIQGIANDDGDLVALHAVEIGTEAKAWVQRQLAVVGVAGARRFDLEADWLDEHDGMTKDNAKKAIGRALHQLDAAKRREGKFTRYWLRQHVPEDAE